MTATDWHQVTPRECYADYYTVGRHLEEVCGPPPAGAVSDEYWGRADADSIRSRHVRWWGCDNGETGVYIDGMQHSDGRLERGISLWLGDHSGITISHGAAVALIAQLQEATTRWDLGDRMTTTTPPATAVDPSTALTIPLSEFDRGILLSLLQKLHESNIRNRSPRGPLPPKLPLVECAPWCDRGDGHPDCYGTSDQACWSPSEYIDFSLEPVLEEGETTFPQRIGVMARREPDTTGAVYLHLDSIKLHGPIPSPYEYLDHSVNLTPGEARALGAALFREAARLEEGGTG